MTIPVICCVPLQVPSTPWSVLCPFISTIIAMVLAAVEFHINRIMRSVPFVWGIFLLGIRFSRFTYEVNIETFLFSIEKYSFVQISHAMLSSTRREAFGLSPVWGC